MENIYIKEIRQRLELHENDTSEDQRIKRMAPFRRVQLIAGWRLGDDEWSDEFKGWCESQGLYLTTDPEANGVI